MGVELLDVPAPYSRAVRSGTCTTWVASTRPPRCRAIALASAMGPPVFGLARGGHQAVAAAVGLDAGGRDRGLAAPAAALDVLAEHALLSVWMHT